MADPVPPREGALIADELRKRDARARDESRASGTQRFQSVKKLKEAIEELQEQQGILAQQQSALTAQQNALASQVAFLQGASVQDARGSILNDTKPASGGISLDGFDGTYDCAVLLTTSSTGKLRVSVGGQLTGFDGVSAVVGYEVIIAGVGIIVGVDWSRVAAAGGGLATTSRESLITVPANTPVQIRTRRGWTGGTGGLCVWGYQSLIVTKEGQ
jgi:hypothetical protein